MAILSLFQDGDSAAARATCAISRLQSAPRRRACRRTAGHRPDPARAHHDAAAGIRGRAHRATPPRAACELAFYSARLSTDLVNTARRSADSCSAFSLERTRANLGISSAPNPATTTLPSASRPTTYLVERRSFANTKAPQLPSFTGDEPNMLLSYRARKAGAFAPFRTADARAAATPLELVPGRTVLDQSQRVFRN